MSDEPVKVQYEGVCEEISEKNGWTTFAINVGTTYPVRLSSKLPALIEQGRAAGQQRAVWHAKESQGNENPNKPGTHYTNRYLDGVEVGGTVQADVPATTVHSATVTTSSSTPTHAPLPPGDKDRAITRMAVLKAAAEIVAAYAQPGVVGPEPPDPAARAIEIAERFERWVYRDVDDIPF